MLDKSLCYDFHKTLGSENEQEGILHFFLHIDQYEFMYILILEASYQYCICFIAVLTREGSVDSQAHTIAHDGEQNEEIKRFPLHKSNAMFPEINQINCKGHYKSQGVSGSRGFSV